MLKPCKYCKLEFRRYKTTDRYCSYKCKNKDAKNDDSLGKQLSRLETLTNRLVKIIDKKQDCLSSGIKNPKPSAGHVITLGSNPQLRFHLMNIYLQDFYENSGHKDTEYKQGIIKTFGQEHMDMINGLKGKYRSLNLMTFEIKSKIIITKECIKEAQKMPKLTTLQRIEVREYFQKRLGIYK